MGRNINEFLDVPASLKDGQHLEISSVEKARDKLGNYYIIVSDDVRYKTYSQTVIKAIEAALEKKFDFKSDTLSCDVKTRLSEKGNNYLTLV